jgi:hypothetical protein
MSLAARPAAIRVWVLPLPAGPVRVVASRPSVNARYSAAAWSSRSPVAVLASPAASARSSSCASSVRVSEPSSPATRAGSHAGASARPARATMRSSVVS